MRARVRRSRSVSFVMRVSSRSCGVSAPTRAMSLGIAAMGPNRFFQNSMAAASSLPLSAASPTSIGRSSFFAMSRLLLSRGLAAALGHGLAHVRGDLVERRTGLEDALHAVRAQARDVVLRDDASSEEQHVVHALFLHELGD